jgi:outer membrane receptor protein involved in Fe transport
MGYDGSWLSTDQIPQRAVEQGLISRFGLVDPGPRGETTRTSLSGQLRRGDQRSLTTLGAYAIAYDFALVSNFTYFLEDPERGDQFEQRDDRTVLGLDLAHRRFATAGSRPVELAVGLQGRFDDIANGLYRTQELARVATVREDDIEQLGGGAWSEVTVQWLPRLRATLGLRVDRYEARVDSDLAANSGTAADTIVSPKLSIAVGPWRDTELYATWGRGFHSNDARGATIRVDPVSGEPAAAVDPLVRAEGVELGVRTAAVRGLQSTLTLHRLELDSELVFVGDGGATEASRPSRRLGVEWTNAWQARPWLVLDLDLAWVDAEFTDADPAGAHIPGALESVVSGGFRLRRGDWSGALRVRAFGDYPLLEDDSVRAGSTVVVNARLARALGERWELALEGFNLLDREDSDIEYWYASRLPGEPGGGVEDVHFHPVEGIAGRLGLAYRF